MKLIDDKLSELIGLLISSGNSSKIYFEKIRECLKNPTEQKEELDLFLMSTPIIQYAGFTGKETKLYREIYNLLESELERFNSGA